MGEAQVEWAKRKRRELILELGGTCVDCGTNDMDLLEIDHIKPRDWIANKVASDQRVRRYQREAREGKLEVRCGPCNKAKYYRAGEVLPERAKLP